MKDGFKVDLKTYFQNPIDRKKIKAQLIELGFTIEEKKGTTLVKADDDERNRLISKFDSGKVNISEFLEEVKIRYQQLPIQPIRTDVGIIKWYEIDNLNTEPYRIKYIYPLNLPTEDNVELQNRGDSGALLNNLNISSSELQPEIFARMFNIEHVNPGTPEITPEPEVSKEVLPQWRNLPPTDKEDWVEINDSRFQAGIGWGIAAASRRGKAHAHDGTHRDDSFDFAFQGGWSILACADGAGSCRLSRVGARICCQVAVQNLKKLLNGVNIIEDVKLTIPEETDLLKIKQFLIDTVKLALKSVKYEASQRGVEYDLLSTTMLIAIHHKWLDKSLVASIQVGDGAVVVWYGGTNVSVLGKADSGDFASETKFITSNGIEDEIDHKVFFAIKSELDAVAIMTDGVSDDFFPPEKLMPGMFQKVYQEILKDEPDEKLLEWLAYELRGSFDDRTMVVLHRR